MDVIQLLITIVVVTILVTIVLAIVTYVAYKLRLAREPSALERPEDGPRYFVLYDPPASSLRSQEGDGGTSATASVEGHATQA